MTESAPLVTVTVCVRNGAKWVEGCMDSLLKQTWRPLEIVAVDDGSTDGSADLLQAFHDPSGEVPVRVLRRAAEGLSAGRDAAAEAANGEWIAITDIDVRPMPDWIEALMSARLGLDNEDVTAVTGPKLEPTTVAFDRVTMLSSFMRDSQCGCEMTDTRSRAVDSVASRWCEKTWEMKQAAESRSAGACAAPHTRLVSKRREGRQMAWETRRT